MILDEDEVGILREDELGSLDGIDVRGLFHSSQSTFSLLIILEISLKQIIAWFYHHKEWFPKHLFCNKPIYFTKYDELFENVLR